MTRTPSCHLLDMLAEVPDPRKKKGCRHPLKAMLAITVIGLLCGLRSYTAIATWARSEPELAKTVGFTAKKTPCVATFHNVYKRLDVVKLEETLTQWIAKTLESHPAVETSRLTAVAIDGKSLRGSESRQTPMTHLLSVVSHEFGLPLTQCAVSEKTNEVPLSTQILRTFDVAGKVITTDALLTQRAFSQDVIELQADYCLPIKANQEQLYMDIRDLFRLFDETAPAEVRTRRFAALHTQEHAHLDAHTDFENISGYRISRTLTASTLLNEYTDWPGLKQVYEYQIQRKHLATGDTTHQTLYGITSLAPETASAEDLLKLRRGHWTIENKLHWIRDTVSREDASNVRTGVLPQVMAAMRNTAICVLRFTGHTKITQTLRTFAQKPKLAVNLIK